MSVEFYFGLFPVKAEGHNPIPKGQRKLKLHSDDTLLTEYPDSPSTSLKPYLFTTLDVNRSSLECSRKRLHGQLVQYGGVIYTFTLRCSSPRIRLHLTSEKEQPLADMLRLALSLPQSYALTYQSFQ